MNRLAALFIRLVFLEEFGVLPFLGFSIAFLIGLAWLVAILRSGRL